MTTYPSTLKLFDVPFVFSQGEALNASAMVKSAKEWGIRVSRRELEQLASSGLLVPFFRISDQADPSMVVRTAEGDHTWPAYYAGQGHLRDPALESYVAPTSGSEHEPPGWNEFLYSQWQLFDLANALTILRSPEAPDAQLLADASRLRHERMALAALSTRFLPAVINRLRLPSGSSQDALWGAQDNWSGADLLAAVSYPTERLSKPAELLLSSARSSDPLRDLWPLFRHADHRAWFAVSGPALAANWKRIAAEVLLRAHEEFTNSRILQPLNPRQTGRLRPALADRIGDTAFGPSLEGALAEFGLSTTPRVILAVEGATEAVHLRALMDELGVLDATRLISLEGSGNTPAQLARLVSPRISHQTDLPPRLESGPTALVIAVDPENKYETPEQRGKVAERLRGIVRDGVREQGGDLTPNELATLVRIRVWPDHSYEFANFTDEELFDGLRRIAERPLDQVSEQRLRSEISRRRAGGSDFKHVFHAMQWDVRKLQLAETLVPVVLADLQHEGASRPVVALALEVAELVNDLSRGGYRLATAPYDRPLSD